MQPSGSDIFTGATNVSYATAVAAAFTQPGYYQFTVQAGDAYSIASFEVAVWPANALTIDQMKYTDAAKTGLRDSNALRAVLRNVARESNKAAIKATLEGGAAVSPLFGLVPATLGLAGTLAPYTW